MLERLLLLAAAGAAGALCRYGLCLIQGRLGGSTFPWGTMGGALSGALLPACCSASSRRAGR